MWWDIIKSQFIGVNISMRKFALLLCFLVYFIQASTALAGKQGEGQGNASTAKNFTVTEALTRLRQVQNPSNSFFQGYLENEVQKNPEFASYWVVFVQNPSGQQQVRIQR